MPYRTPGKTDRSLRSRAPSGGVSTQNCHPVPWTVLRRAIDDAIRSRWLETAPGSGFRPCDAAVYACWHKGRRHLASSRSREIDEPLLGLHAVATRLLDKRLVARAGQWRRGRAEVFVTLEENVNPVPANGGEDLCRDEVNKSRGALLIR